MATVRIRHVKHPRELALILTSPQGSVAKDLFRRGVKVTAQAKKNLSRDPQRINTGHLRSDIKPQLLMLNGKPVCRVGFTVFYGMFVHEGTGIYGPRGAPIRPVSAKVLSWKTKSGKRVYAMQVKGMRPNPFLKDALGAAKD